MAGIKPLRKIQIGKETTPGTAVAATALWRGTGVLDDQREVTFVEEDVGYISGLDRTHVAKLLAAIQMDSTPATFEQLPYLFNAGIKGVAGSQDGAGTDYIYTYALPTTSKNTIYNYTIEGGDDQQAEEIEHAFVEELSLTGKPGEALMMSANWLGRQASLASFTGSIAVPTVEDILFSMGKLWIDAIGGTIGTTLVSNTFLGMDLKLKTGWVPVFGADGALYFSFAKLVEPELTIQLTFEHDSVGVARKADWRAQTARLFRVQFEGNTVGTPGTTYSKKTLRLDFASKIEKVDPLGDIDGNDVYTVNLRPRYNSTAAQFATFLVVNELSALP